MRKKKKKAKSEKRKERYEKGLEDSKSMAFFCHHFYGHFSHTFQKINKNVYENVIQ